MLVIGGTDERERSRSPFFRGWSVVGGAFIPSFALGIPGSPFMAVMMGGMMLHGLAPGPTLFQRTEVIWPFVASVYVGAVMLLAINLFMIPFFVWILKISQRFINPVVLVLCVLGVFEGHIEELAAFGIHVCVPSIGDGFTSQFQR